MGKKLVIVTSRPHDVGVLMSRKLMLSSCKMEKLFQDMYALDAYAQHTRLHQNRIYYLAL